MNRKLALSLSATWLVAAAPAVTAVNVQANPNGFYYTAVLTSGPSIDRYDIVFVGDGFSKSDQTAFNARVEDAVAALKAMVPYSELMCGFNIWRVNVISNQSGVDHPADGIFRNTELDCRYGNPAAGEAERCITSNSPAKCFEAAAFAPDADAVFVLVNDTAWGGCSDSLVFSSISPGFSDIITHELGHKIGLLADEYTCYFCDGSDSNGTYTGLEPEAANATKATTLTTLKWKWGDLITGSTPLPTTVDSPPGVVGIWEGAFYKAKGVYRPQSTCHMQTTGSPFCKVCEGEMRNELEVHCSCIACIDLSEFLACEPPCGKIRWPFPPGCLSCLDFRLDDEIILILQGPSEEYTLEVLNDHAEVIAQGVHTEQGLKLEFRARRSDQYYFELTGPGREQRTLNIRANLFRNGKQENLPQAVVR